MSRTLKAIQEHIDAGRVRVSVHGMAELADDAIDLAEVLAGVASAVAIEDYPDYYKGPSVLCLQRDAGGRPLHVLWGVAALNPDVATIITAYRPDPSKWMDDLVTRKPK